MISGVYQIKNINSGKIYIGSAAISITKRWHRHKSLLRGNKHYNKHLQNAWNKDGENSFEWSIVEEVPDKNLVIEREQYHMDDTQCYERINGYNLCKVAGSILGQKRSAETKRKMSISRTGILHTEETKKHLSDIKKGKKVFGQEHYDMLSKKFKGRISPNKNNFGHPNCKAIIQLDLDGNVIKNWDSALSVERECGYNRSNINSCCRGNRNKAYGFRWEFKISKIYT